MKSKTFVIHQIFSCEKCGITWEDYTNARKKAYAHAKATGHKVTGETGTSIQYNV